MKIVVVGGTGLIGSRTVSNLRRAGHEVVAASPSKGINALTGEGLAEALTGAEVVVDVANSPALDDKAVLAFFEASSRNLLAAEAAAGVKHHVALSIVGTDRLQGNGYLRAKLAQETLIAAGSIPYTIVRATQFFEFLPSIAYMGTQGDTVRLTPAAVQPIASDDVGAILAEVAVAAPVNGRVEIAGPERAGLSEMVQRYLTATGDPRKVVADAAVGYFGAAADDTSLVPGDGPRIGPTTFEAWMAQQPKKAG